MMERLLALYVDMKAREEGQTMVEYAAVLAVVVLLVAGIGTTGLSGGISDALTDVANKLKGIIP